ncbi:MAG TPA: signal peptidase I [Candidatus Paceibacterota bacterium]|nr:signal peptidase I [Candidatus Paceibacterota bacterium]
MEETLKQPEGGPIAERGIWTKKNVLSVALIAFLVVLFIRLFVFETFFVQGDSMSPTILSGQFVFVNRLAYIWSEPKRGDIVVAIPRVYPGRVVKRVIGLPGEWFSIENGAIVIRDSRTGKGVNLDEAYLKLPYTPEVGTTRTNIDPKEYFALGDNRAESIDSRELGPIDLWSIKGKVVGAFDFKTFKYKAF